jgi:acyl-CoA thioesterase II
MDDGRRPTAAPEDAGDAIPDLADIMALEPLGEDRFRAHAHKGNHVGAVFGGSLLVQALRAAEATAPGRTPHAMHAHFHRAGDATAPIDHLVERIRDGGASSTRRVSAQQGGRLLFDTLITLQAPSDEGFEHQQAWRSVPPPPDRTPTTAELAEAWADRLSPEELATLQRLGSGFDIRIVDVEAFMRSASPAFGAFWVRPRANAARRGGPDYGALVFTSDFMMARAATMPHLRSAWDPHGWTISLDHAIWLHAPAPQGGWMLYEIESPWAGGGRGLSLGRMYDEDGRLLATVAQEALIRTRGGGRRET